MGKIIAIGNIKGGVGKTTITGQLALAFAHFGWPIGLVDADLQCGLHGWLDCASGLACDALPFTSSTSSEEWSERVRAAARKHQLTLIDLPAAMPAAIDAAARLADILLIPVGPSAAELRATEMTLEIIARLPRQPQHRLKPLLLPNRLGDDEIGHALLSWGRLLDLDIMPAVRKRDYFVDALTHLNWHAGRPARRDILLVAQALLTYLTDGSVQEKDQGPASAVPVDPWRGRQENRIVLPPSGIGDHSRVSAV